MAIFSKSHIVLVVCYGHPSPATVCPKNANWTRSAGILKRSSEPCRWGPCRGNFEGKGAAHCTVRTFCRMDSGWPKEAWYCIGWGAHRRHLANTTELSMCYEEAAFFVKLLWPLVIIIIIIRPHRGTRKRCQLSSVASLSHWASTFKVK